MHPKPVPPPPPADKALLRNQLDQTALAKKELEENCRKAGATLTKATQEQESCQRDLLNTRIACEPAKSNLELLKHECRSLRSDMNYFFQRIKGLAVPYSCNDVNDQVTWLTQQTEGLFLWQQERETKYMGKTVCDMNMLQCHMNCSREKQDLDKRLQDAEKQVKGNQEEKKKLLVEKEQLSKELEEKSKAATQAGHFKEQLNICVGSKVRELPGHGDIPGHPPWPCREHTRPGTHLFLLHVPFCKRTLARAFSLARALLHTHAFFCKQHASARLRVHPRHGQAAAAPPGPLFAQRCGAARAGGAGADHHRPLSSADGHLLRHHGLTGAGQQRAAGTLCQHRLLRGCSEEPGNLREYG